MPARTQPGSAARQNKPPLHVVHFPTPSGGKRPAAGLHLGSLLPRRWRRQVVIQGRRFWLPG